MARRSERPLKSIGRAIAVVILIGAAAATLAVWLRPAFAGPANARQTSGSLSAQLLGQHVDPVARAEYWANRLGLRFGVPPHARSAAISQMRQMEAAGRAAVAPGQADNSLSVPLVTPSWTFIGPEPMLNSLPNFGGPAPGATYGASGRISAIATDPAGRIYAGAAGGGVWMSVDNGAHFKPIFDNGPTQAIGAIAVDAVHTNPPTIYVATGEGNSGGDTYYGDGIFKSTNLGASWTQLGPAGQFDHISFTRLAIDTTHNPPHLIATAIGGVTSGRADPLLFPRDPRKQGYWISQDGGATWAQFADTTCTNSGLTVPCPGEDVVIDPTDTNQVYFAIKFEGVWVSTNGGTNFNLACFTNDSPCTFPNAPGALDRVSLAVGPPAKGAPLNCSGGTKPCGVVYAMIGSSNGKTYAGFTESIDGGKTWLPPQTVPSFTNTKSGSICDGTGASNFAQESYDQTLLVSPANPALVFFGGVGIYDSSNSGAIWTFMPGTHGGTHSDQHALALAADKNTVYLGNDGGLYSFKISSISGGQVTFTDNNATLPVGQIQGIGPHPTTNTRLLAGFQDNGTNLDTGPLGWNATRTGDGGFSLFDQSNPALAYSEFATSGGLPAVGRSSDAGLTWDINDPINALFVPWNAAKDPGAAFYAPIATDPGPGTPGRVLVGSHHIYASVDGMLHFTEQENADLTGGCTNGSCAIQDIEFAPSDRTRAWSLSIQSGTTPFRLFKTMQASLNTGAVWTLVTTLPFNTASTQATGISPDPHNANRAFLSISGFKASTHIAHIWVTTNFGTSWTAADTGLPDIPVLRVLVDKTDATGKTLYAGTDIGMFKSTNGGASWVPFNLAVIPAVAAFDVEQNNNGVIFVGTHGRGAYQLVGAAAPTPTPVRTPIRTPTRTPAKTTTRTPVRTPVRTPTRVIVGTPTPKVPTRTPTKVIGKTPTPTPRGPTPKATPTSLPTPKLLSKTYLLNLSAPSVPGCVDSAAQTLIGAALGDVCTASLSVAIKPQQVLGCFVSAANAVTFRVCQPSGTFPTDPDGPSGAIYRAVVAH